MNKELVKLAFHMGYKDAIAKIAGATLIGRNLQYRATHPQQGHGNQNWAAGAAARAGYPVQQRKPKPVQPAVNLTPRVNETPALQPQPAAPAPAVQPQPEVQPAPIVQAP